MIPTFEKGSRSNDATALFFNSPFIILQRFGLRTLRNWLELKRYSGNSGGDNAMQLLNALSRISGAPDSSSPARTLQHAREKWCGCWATGGLTSRQAKKS